MLTLWILFLLAVLGFLAYHRTNWSTVLGVSATIMVLGTVLGPIGIFTWVLYLAITLPFAVTSLRQQYIVAPALAFFKKVLPPMSDTEKAAIDAGTTWWEADLFQGAPNWHKLHQFPVPRLTAEEQAFIDNECETLCAMVDDWQVTHVEADLPADVWQYLKDNKFFAMIIEKKYGGLEFSAYAQSRVLQKLCSKSMVLASIVGVPNSLGPGELLQHYGTEEQKDHYLPRLAKGDEIPCFALTSPEAGSDAGAIPDYGVVCKGMWQGEEILGMRLTWNKRYITLAPVATVLGLAFKLRDPDGLLGDKEDIGITCALIPVSTEGVIIGRRHFPLNVPFQNGPTQGNDVFVPLDYIIGGQAMAGHGWRMLVECLSVGRAITLPSNSAGGIKAAAMASGSYSRIRRQFKMPIGHMEGVEECLARIGGYAYSADAAVTMSVGAVDLGEKPSVISAILKYHLTERMRQSITDAMDIHGGKGIMLGKNNYLARGYQGAPVAITVEGANILTRNMIIYGQGAIRCHPFVLREMQIAACEDKKQALNDFDRALAGHIGFAMSNWVRALWLSLTNAKFANAPFNDATKQYYQQAARFSASLAFVSDVAMAVLGGKLKRKERLSARLGDLLSHLYLLSATLKRFHDEGRKKEDMPLVHWSCADNVYQMQEALAELIGNFPNRALRVFLRLSLLPLGHTLRRPTDRLEHRVSQLLQKPSETRDRIGQGIYLTDEPNNLIGRQEQALKDILAAEPVFERVCRQLGEKLPFYNLDEVAEKGSAAGVISEKEADLLRRAETGRKQAINVDDFDPAELPAGKVSKPKKASQAA